MPTRDVRAPQSGILTALLITDEDCCLEDFDLSNLDICGTATLSCSHLRSPLNVADAVLAFEAGALADAASRRNDNPVHLMATDPPFVTRGPLRDWLEKAEVILTDSGITLCEQRRNWDDAIWPHATAGFFKIRKHIPRILDQTVLA